MLTTTRLSLLLCGVLGVGITAALAVYAGLGAVYGALDDVGWLGIAWVCMLQLASMAFCAAAWRGVADKMTFLSCLTARFIRVGVSNLAGIIPAVGVVAGGRALSLLCAAACRAVADKMPSVSSLRAWAIPDGVANLPGITPAVGEVAGAPALSLLGPTAGIAAASTVVDVAIESLSQAIYTLIGLIPL